MGLFSKNGDKGDGKKGKKAEGKKGKPADKAKDEKPKDEAPADPEVAELKALFTKPPDPPGNPSCGCYHSCACGRCRRETHGHKYPGQTADVG